MKIHLASDHGGFELKGQIKEYLEHMGHAVADHGAHEYDELDDYPDFVLPCAEAVANEKGSRGIVLGRSGQGEAMAANRVKGIRATVYYAENENILKYSRLHNDANVISFAGDYVTMDQIKRALDIWLVDPFSGETKYQRRIDKVENHG